MAELKVELTVSLTYEEQEKEYAHCVSLTNSSTQQD